MKRLDSRSRTTEVDDVSDRLIALYDEQNALADDTFLKSVFDEMRILSANITEAIKRDKAYSNLEAADTLRDDKVRAISFILQGYCALPIADVKAAAESLRTTFAKYGVGITTDNYASESSLIESLLGDFATAGAQAAIAKLNGMATAVAELRAAQTDFTVARLEYEKSVSKLSSAVNASSIKKPLLAVINGKMVKYLDTMTMVDAAKYEQYAANVAQIIDDMNAVVARRLSTVVEAGTAESGKVNSGEA